MKSNEVEKIIFLDIDGVLDYQYSLDHSPEKATALKKELLQKNPKLENISIFDLSIAYNDWQNSAIEYLHNLCQKTGAFIVICSSWRLIYSVEDLKNLFDLYDLGKYVIDKTEDLDIKNGRATEIRTYLAKNKHIKNYVILDDDEGFYVNDNFGNRFISTNEYEIFTEKQYEIALKILSV
ncbi:MAG: hypothetical protein EAZ44_05515 [Cytophagia bacterium]|nr:MAG: hypothetical protein EAZ44_05515 [Cytophagia bacterium]TAG43319.1 MAG: hypothetical protein EAZ31_04575 [Cytophagia bacterium]